MEVAILALAIAVISQAFISKQRLIVGGILLFMSLFHYVVEAYLPDFWYYFSAVLLSMAGIALIYRLEMTLTSKRLVYVLGATALVNALGYMIVYEYWLSPSWYELPLLGLYALAVTTLFLKDAEYNDVGESGINITVRVLNRIAIWRHHHDSAI